MRQLAQADELGILLQRTLTAAEETTAILLLESATAEIEAEVGRIFEETDHDHLLAGSWSADLELPQKPVTAVTSVTVNDVALASGNWTWNDRTLLRGGGAPVANGFALDLEDDWYVYGMQGAGWRQGLHWAGPASTIRVVYTAGYSEGNIPGDLRSMCLQVAARTFTNPAQVRSESLGAYAVGFTIPATGEPFGVMLTEGERRTLRRRYGHTSTTVVAAHS